MANINWKLVGHQLAEAREALEELEALTRLSGKRSEGALQVGLEHAYHHINFAWNARRMSAAQHRSLTEKQFRSNSLYPKTLEPLGAETAPVQTKRRRRIGKKR